MPDSRLPTKPGDSPFVDPPLGERGHPVFAFRLAWNFVLAKLHRSSPCGRCGYRYDCPDGECHS